MRVTARSERSRRRAARRLGARRAVARVARVTDAVAVEVRLAGVLRRRAVVAGVAQLVPVAVRLIDVREPGTVVEHVRDLVVIAVQRALAGRRRTGRDVLEAELRGAVLRAAALARVGAAHGLDAALRGVRIGRAGLARTVHAVLAGAALDPGHHGMRARAPAAPVDGAEVAVVAVRRDADAGPVEALVQVRTELAVVARRAVRLLRVRAVAGGGLTGAGGVALVHGLARLVGARVARARRALVVDGALVAVVAGRVVRRGRVRAEPRRGVARARRVAVVLRHARDRAGARAHARLAGVDRRASAGVVAGDTVRDRDVLALVVLTRIGGADVAVVAPRGVHAADLRAAVRAVLVPPVPTVPLRIALLLDALVLVGQSAGIRIVRVPDAVRRHGALGEVGRHGLDLVTRLGGRGAGDRPRRRLRGAPEHCQDRELRGPLHNIPHLTILPDSTFDYPKQEALTRQHTSTDQFSSGWWRTPRS